MLVAFDYTVSWCLCFACVHCSADAIAMGEVELPIIGTVDLMPPHLERAIFTKMWTAVVSNLLETELTVAGVRMRMCALDDEQHVPERPPSRDIRKFLRDRKRAS